LEEVDIRKSKAKCPKCKSIDIIIYEKCLHIQSWEQKDGFIDRNEGYMNPEGVVGTYGECDCGHKWKFRCLQITNLFIEDKL